MIRIRYAAIYRANSGTLRLIMKALALGTFIGNNVEEITGEKTSSTVEVLVVGRNFDEATGVHFLVTSDDAFRHVCKMGGSWESEGWILVRDESSPTDKPANLYFEEHRTDIHQLKVVRRHR